MRICKLLEIWIRLLEVSVPIWLATRCEITRSNWAESTSSHGRHSSSKQSEAQQYSLAVNWLELVLVCRKLSFGYSIAIGIFLGHEKVLDACSAAKLNHLHFQMSGSTTLRNSARQCSPRTLPPKSGSKSLLLYCFFQIWKAKACRHDDH